MQPALRSALLAIALACPALLAAETAYAPPQVAPGENGWETYVDAPLIERSSATGLDAALTTPEGAVTRYLASRIRGDKDWRTAMTDAPDRKAKKALKAWNGWTLHSARLQARKMKQDRGYVSVWMDFTVQGDRDSGTDDFTVIREGDGWRVAAPPS